MTKKIIDDIRGYVFNNFRSAIPDMGDMALELVLVYYSAEQTFDINVGGSVEGWCWYKVKKGAYDYLRKHGKYKKRTSKDQDTKRPGFIYPDQGNSSDEDNNSISWNDLGSALSCCNIKTHSERYLIMCLDELPARERMIIILHYFYGHKLNTICKIFLMHETRISQIHRNILNKLRIKIKEKHGKVHNVLKRSGYDLDNAKFNH